MPGTPHAPSPPATKQIKSVTAASEHWYVHFSAIEMDHNDHLVIAWAVLDDNVTVMPLISSPDNARDIVQAVAVAADYTLLNSYSQCPDCVRP
jgi:hypothetical protein